jgi:uncharacterized protein (UPF0548 family)
MTNFTYAEVGATDGGQLPYGYNHLCHRAVVGHGEEALRAAGEAVVTFAMHRASGVQVAAEAGRAAPGVAVTSSVGVGPLRLSAPCAVVWTVDEADRIGFAYGTLPGHPECGEEAFVVERGEGGAVWLTVTAFSRPARWYTRAAGPLVPLLQRAYARRCASTLRGLL